MISIASYRSNHIHHTSELGIALACLHGCLPLLVFCRLCVRFCIYVVGVVIGFIAVSDRRVFIVGYESDIEHILGEKKKKKKSF